MDITFKYTPTGLRQSVGYLVPKDPEFPQTVPLTGDQVFRYLSLMGTFQTP